MNGDAEDDIRDNLKFFNRDVGDLRLVLEGYIRDGIIKECLNPSSVGNKCLFLISFMYL